MYKLLLSPTRCNEESEDVIIHGLEMFENELANRRGPFFGGSHPGMLDYMIWPWCERADLLRLFGNKCSIRKEKFKRLVRIRFKKLLFFKNLSKINRFYLPLCHLYQLCRMGTSLVRKKNGQKLHLHVDNF